MSAYRTVRAALRFEPERVKGSRFVADVFPIADEAEALARLAELRAEFADASHVCFAWRLGPSSGAYRVWDDGEPGSSAGLPILRRIEAHELFDVCVAVTRWFGGTKLGVGGLMRAYGGAAGMALDRSEVRVVHEKRRLVVRFRYDDSRAVEAVLRSRGLVALESEFGADVTHVLEVAVDAWQAIATELVDATSGRARVDP